MKRKIVLLVGISAAVCAVTLGGLYGWIAYTIKQNMAVAVEKYPGSPEDALISYLQDETNPPRKRTHTAVWTLGMIGSRKALPVLYGYYRNDPEGKTCHGRHETDLCQYEIHKAIQAIEKERPISFQWLK